MNIPYNSGMELERIDLAAFAVKYESTRDQILSNCIAGISTC